MARVGCLRRRRALAGAAANLRRLAERGIRDGVQRVVERAQLAAELQEPVARLEAAVDALEGLRDPVEPLEQRIELSVRDVVSLHTAILRTALDELAATPEEDADERTHDVDADVERSAVASLDEHLVHLVGDGI